MYDTVLLPTDGSEGAKRAAGHARTLARVADATVRVVTVVDVRQFESDRVDLDEVSDERRDRLDRAAREAIAAAEDALGDGVATETEVRYGVPHAEILDSAEARDADVVVMGTHGRTGLDRALVGSTAERVVRVADRPVFTVGPDAAPTDGYRTVLAPTDGSDGVDPAVAHALDLADGFDATVHGLFVADVRSFVSGDDHATPDSALDALEARGQDATAAVAERARERGLDAVAEVVDGVPTSAILDYAEDCDADVVVVGTHGRTGLDRLLLGSVTENLVRRADCPVLTVRRTDGE